MYVCEFGWIAKEVFDDNRKGIAPSAGLRWVLLTLQH